MDEEQTERKWEIINDLLCLRSDWFVFFATFINEISRSARGCFVRAENEL